MKNFLSVTPCSLALNALILELIDSAEAFVEIVQYFIVIFISYTVAVEKPTHSENITLTKRRSTMQPNGLPNGRAVIMPNTIGRRSCTAWHIQNVTACHQERNLSAAGSPTVCILVCQSRRCFMATSSRTPLTICHRVFSTSTTAARSLFMNWSTSRCTPSRRRRNPDAPCRH